APRMLLPLMALQLLAVAVAQSQTDENKIIGGYTCIQHSQPWQAALLAGPMHRFLCGGVLLSDRWAITAAHCARMILWVALGKHNLRRREATQQVLRVARQVPHPQYNSRTHDNDLMLLRLERPARLGRAGDSGGPLVCGGQLQGLVSWGMERCAQPGYPGVYTNLCKYHTWIQQTMQSK
ncbi:Kallikrein-14, partial [Pteropus alecto]